MAVDAGDQRATQAVRDCKDGYEAKKIGYGIKQSNGWNDKKEDVIAKAQEKNMDKTKT